MWALLERICSPKSQGLQDQTPPPQKWETWCQRHQDFAEELSDLGWGAPLFLFGVLADPKHPEIQLPPPKKCHSLAPCSILPFLPHSLSHQWTTVFWHCLWEAQNKCHTCLAMTPTARSGWLSIYKHYCPLVPPTLQPFLPSFWGPSTVCLFNLSKSINC